MSNRGAHACIVGSNHQRTGLMYSRSSYLYALNCCGVRVPQAKTRACQRLVLRARGRQAGEQTVNMLRASWVCPVMSTAPSGDARGSFVSVCGQSRPVY